MEGTPVFAAKRTNIILDLSRTDKESNGSKRGKVVEMEETGLVTPWRGGYGMVLAGDSWLTNIFGYPRLRFSLILRVGWSLGS